MARLRTKLGGDINDLESVILSQVFSRSKVESLRRKVLPLVQEEINKAVEKTKGAFNPRTVGGDELVGQLGVGTGGRIEDSKINNAWRQLQIGINPSVVKLSTQFQPRNFRRFGVINYEIDKTAFYSQKITTYRSQRARDSTLTIPWMQNFIDGIEVSDHEFVSPGDEEYRRERSRTGAGHMIRVPGRQFSFPGVGDRATFGVLTDNINKALSSRQFTSRLASVIASALGG